jgi:hypothetical protein
MPASKTVIALSFAPWAAGKTYLLPHCPRSQGKLGTFADAGEDAFAKAVLALTVDYITTIRVCILMPKDPR